MPVQCKYDQKIFYQKFSKTSYISVPSKTFDCTSTKSVKSIYLNRINQNLQKNNLKQNDRSRIITEINKTEIKLYSNDGKTPAKHLKKPN